MADTTTVQLDIAHLLDLVGAHGSTEPAPPDEAGPTSLWSAPGRSPQPGVVRGRDDHADDGVGVIVLACPWLGGLACAEHGPGRHAATTSTAAGREHRLPDVVDGGRADAVAEPGGPPLLAARSAAGDLGSERGAPDGRSDIDDLLADLAGLELPAELPGIAWTRAAVSDIDTVPDRDDAVGLRAETGASPADCGAPSTDGGAPPVEEADGSLFGRGATDAHAGTLGAEPDRRARLWGRPGSEAVQRARAAGRLRAEVACHPVPAGQSAPAEPPRPRVSRFAAAGIDDTLLPMPRKRR